MEQTNRAPTEPQAMISLRNLRVSYGEREILHGISFDVMRGETLVILGGSGSGKSTLLRTLVGLERTSSGEIWLKGKNIAAISSQEMDEILEACKLPPVEFRVLSGQGLCQEVRQRRSFRDQTGNPVCQARGESSREPE